MENNCGRIINDLITGYLTEEEGIFVSVAEYFRVLCLRCNCTFEVVTAYLYCTVFGGSALCSPVPMFPEPIFPGTYVPQYLCSLVPMFPDFGTLIVD